MTPRYRGDDALVCAACMPEFVPSCPLCGRLAASRGDAWGFNHYEAWALCPPCVVRVRAAGPWKLRRARALEARVGALQTRFPELRVVETAHRRVTLGGTVSGRAVSATLKIAARQGEEERYVLRVELRSPRESVDRASLALDPKLLAMLSRSSPSITRDSHRWLRIGFRHIGKLDILAALEALLSTAVQLDGGA